ncbi:MAG TPA: hypothetical protein VMV92_45500 [Streptosporangiaceae bacterium]|nr:hypothetical protein [Streptosporangiaceae bacterium]
MKWLILGGFIIVIAVLLLIGYLLSQDQFDGSSTVRRARPDGKEVEMVFPAVKRTGTTTASPGSITALTGTPTRGTASCDREAARHVALEEILGQVSTGHESLRISGIDAREM